MNWIRKHPIWSWLLLWIAVIIVMALFGYGTPELWGNILGIQIMVGGIVWIVMKVVRRDKKQ
jgi:hypothetical protein